MKFCIEELLFNCNVKRIRGRASEYLLFATYANPDLYVKIVMKSLEQKLIMAREGKDIWDHTGLSQEPIPARNIMVATDGVFSMDGDIGNCVL